MSDLQRTVTVIPAKPQMMQETIKHQLRVAAYCRVSTEEEEQQSSYEAQCSYYTDKIMTNPEWTMAGIFADEGISFIHERMPVILPSEATTDWLNPRYHGNDILRAALTEMEYKAC